MSVSPTPKVFMLILKKLSSLTFFFIRVGMKCPDAGFRGRVCETVVDPCLSQPCRNGGTCNTLDGGSYSCTCPLGTSGLRCEEDINECESRPCKNGGQCSQPALGTFRCTCEAGYTGSTCGVGTYVDRHTMSPNFNDITFKL